MFSRRYSVNKLPGDTKQNGDGEGEGGGGVERPLFDILYSFNALAGPLGQSNCN